MLGLQRAPYHNCRALSRRWRVVAALSNRYESLSHHYRIVIELLSHSNRTVFAQCSHRTMQKSCYATQPIVNLTVTVVNVNDVIDINVNYRCNVNININTIINTNTAEY